MSSQSWQSKQCPRRERTPASQGMPFARTGLAPAERFASSALVRRLPEARWARLCGI